MSEAPDSFHRSLDAARARHFATCVFCRSETVTGQPNSEGHWYMRCSTCGTRFWADRPPKLP